MIGYIKGNLLYYTDNTVVIENNGIGYEVCCSSSAFEKVLQDKRGALFTYTAVREDGIYLYGFINLEEKNMFLKLITVSGIGPKLAISILSGISLPSLALAIATSDVKTLSKIKGCGKKTAERIIVELREKISAEGSDVERLKEELPATNEENDAVIALMSLGFNRKESVMAVKSALLGGAKSINDIITYALRSFG